MPPSAFDAASNSPYANFLLAFTAVFCFLAVIRAARLEGGRRVAGVLLALLLLAGGVAFVSVALPGRNSVVNLIKNDKFLTMLGGLSGALAGLSIGAATAGAGRLIGYLATFAVIGVCGLALGKGALKGAGDRAASEGFAAGPTSTEPGKASAARVRVEPYASLNVLPMCMTLGPDGALYVGGANNDIHYNGVVMRVGRGADGKVAQKLVAEHLVRPHGLAFHDGDLFVARTGEVSVAEKGMIKYKPSGSVTRLTDTDGDGVYDLYRDIITELPGTYGLHQVAGIVFDEAGFLYVSVGVAEDHAPVIEPYEGTILRARPDGSDVTIFARGVRNPYDLVIGPGGELFCTDNDADERNRGDVIHHVRQGDHLGFPYTQTVGAPKIKGVAPPTYEPGHSEVLEGLAYAPPGSLPSGFDDCLYVASLWDRSVKRVRVKRGDDGRYVATEATTIAQMKFPLDLAIVPEEKAIYVLCGYEERSIQKIVIE